MPLEDEKSSFLREDFIAKLNDAQRDAVLHTEGPLLILAGAGTGKTRTVTSRMAYIVKSGLALPSQILAVTFTNKAANEMRERINELVCTTGIWLGTFHAMAAKILRAHAELVGLKSDFTIIAPDDQLQVVKALVKDSRTDYSADECKKILNTIQQWKERGLLPHHITDTELRRHNTEPALLVYEEYQEKLRSMNCADFGDLLLHNITIFRAHREVLSYYQDQLKYVMVDEYQDINTSQYLWLRLLVRKYKNICCVGDDDQSIYSWRGAEVGNILKFSDDFPESRVIKLECNYRSTSNILATASFLINNNKSRLKKKLWTTNHEGPKVGLMKFFDAKLEAQYISEYIATSHEYRFSEIAILVRAGFQTRVFEEYFVRYGVPYKIVGGTKFYERQEIRDLISYLKVVTNPGNDIALERILNKPKRQLGSTTLNKMREYAKHNCLSLMDAGKAMVEHELLPNRTTNALKELLGKFEDWKQVLDTSSLVDVMKTIAHESGYLEMLRNEGESGISKLENIKELFSALFSFDDAVKFLEHVSLVTETDPSSEDDDNQVHVMTLHAAKGLEFSLVFLPGWEEGVFPHEKSLNDDSGKALEEERRLAYVGITRARERLFISCVAVREINNWRQPMKISRFIKELPPEHVQVLKNVE
ncbi:ATP-dependent helicase [Anaplasma bovis]|uniref:ATP-dependent helicase n=1 Tax=Anaplasma bovis TaxID=186733 RepID=UPI002FF2FD92